MTTLTTNNHKLLIVEVPEDAYEFEIYGIDNVDRMMQWKRKDAPLSVDTVTRVGWYKDKIEILGTITNGMIEFDYYEFGTQQSFLSLLQSKGIEYKKCVVLRIN